MKQLPLIVAALAIIIIGGTGFYLMQLQNSRPANTISEITSKSNESNDSSTTTLSSLLSLGTNQVCTFTYTDPDSGTTSGTVYFANGKMSGTFNVETQDGQSFDGSMINDGSYIYSWSSLSNQGTKIPVDFDDSSEVKNEPDKPSNFIDDNKQVDYSCSPWGVDQSMFTAPSNITFTDISVQMDIINETTSDLQEQKCAACDNLTGEQLQTCKQALSCN